MIVTTFDDDENLYEALRAGAGGFLLKNAPPEQLVEAVRTVAAGEGLLSTAVTRRVIDEFARRSPSKSPPPDALEELTEREVEVLRLIARGLSNAEIAEELVITPTTAKTRRADPHEARPARPRPRGRVRLRDRPCEAYLKLWWVAP